MAILTTGKRVSESQQRKFKQRQQKFIHRTLNSYPNQNLLMLTLNLPGTIQNNGPISQFFNATQAAFELSLRHLGLSLSQFQITAWQTNAGCVAFYLSKLDFTDLKTNAQDFLKHYPAAELCQFSIISLDNSIQLPTELLTNQKAEQLLKQATQSNN